MSEPLRPLKPLHADSMLSQAKLLRFERLSTEELLKSLQPGNPHCLETRPDGTMLDGHHRIFILKKRDVKVDDLPREIVKPFS